MPLPINKLTCTLTYTKMALDGCSSCVFFEADLQSLLRGPGDSKQVPHGIVLSSVEHFQATNQIQILDSQSCVV